ncbi:MAG: CgeB family protein [Candidatus Cyclobacteriaceae bacterium M2_1C_046]
MKIVTLGLSISSSWGNGHATTFRSLYKGLNMRGHDLYFLEREVPWYAGKNRDFEKGEGYSLIFYSDLQELKEEYEQLISSADVVIVGSYVPDGVEVIDWVSKTAKGLKLFYDIDTPVTLEKLHKCDYEYLRPEQINLFDAYLSFSGGRTLDILEHEYNAKVAKHFYCSFDPDLYYPCDKEEKWILGYLGTYSFDRQPGVDQLLLQPSKIYPQQYVVAGPSYPQRIKWPDNIKRIEHLPPSEHLEFYCSQRFTLNVTRKAMKALGHSPSVRLFEAAACGTAIISDWWEGLDELFIPGEEIIIADTTKDVIEAFDDYDREKAKEMGLKAREKVINEHSGYARAGQLEQYVSELTNVLV